MGNRSWFRHCNWQLREELSDWVGLWTSGHANHIRGSCNRFLWTKIPQILLGPLSIPWHSDPWIPSGISSPRGQDPGGLAGLPDGEYHANSRGKNNRISEYCNIVRSNSPLSPNRWSVHRNQRDSSLRDARQHGRPRREVEGQPHGSNPRDRLSRRFRNQHTEALRRLSSFRVSGSRFGDSDARLPRVRPLHRVGPSLLELCTEAPSS